MNKYEELKKEYVKLGKELEELEAVRICIKQTRSSLGIEMTTERFGVKVGSIVIYKNNEYRVCRIEPHFYGEITKPWIIANPKKKDGTFGVAERNLYEYWELVKA